MQPDRRALLDEGAILELRERLAAAERAGGRFATDRHEGGADGDHAFPGAALESDAMGVVPGANSDIDVSVLGSFSTTSRWAARQTTSRPVSPAGTTLSSRSGSPCTSAGPSRNAARSCPEPVRLPLWVRIPRAMDGKVSLEREDVHVLARSGVLDPTNRVRQRRSVPAM